MFSVASLCLVHHSFNVVDIYIKCTQIYVCGNDDGFITNREYIAYSLSERMI